jgi:hypothetical protein
MQATATPALSINQRNLYKYLYLILFASRK